jgi:hypothetical protein
VHSFRRRVGLGGVVYQQTRTVDGLLSDSLSTYFWFSGLSSDGWITLMVYPGTVPKDGTCTPYRICVTIFERYIAESAMTMAPWRDVILPRCRFEMELTRTFVLSLHDYYGYKPITRTFGYLDTRWLFEETSTTWVM